MPNSVLPSERSFQTFSSWVLTKTDDEFRQMVSRGVLSRTEIARECQFAKSVLSQNPDVKKALKTLEDDLRKRHVLPELVVSKPETAADMSRPRRKANASPTDSDRERQLEFENASLKAENAELKQRLSKYENLHSALVLTGRVPR